MQCTPQHQARGLAEGPLEVGVADLLAARSLHLAGTLVAAPHQPRIRQEVADLREAGDGVDLVEQDQSEDRTDARHRPQQAEGHRVIDPGVLDEVPLQFGDLLVVAVDEGQVGADGDCSDFTPDPSSSPPR